MRDTSTGHSPVTVIGLGLMGRALAEAFLAAGHPTTVWNRSADKADALVARGAVLAASVEDAVTASPLTVVCVSDYEAVHKLLDPVGDGLAGRTVVNLTSGTTTQARETAEWAAGRGADYLDGAIMAIPVGIGTADGLILHSGPRAVFDAHEATLRTLGGDTTYLGEDHGLSALYDTAMLGLMWSLLNGFLHGAALVGTAKVDAAAFAPIARKLIATVSEWTVDYSRQIDRGEYAAEDSTIRTHLGAMEHVLHESEAAGINTELPRFVKALAERAVAAGHAEDGYAAMIGQFRAAG
ncbi:NAD(P)-dependent oxidoreductase [Saccharothrix hoggarensis]|uniref:NAD(P)-dependent oxidoreductase n=1 Tax=Saccharothrix hoggarensis TaxID=913853 RepID=A0ABW3QQ96_9PSEU